MRIFPNVTAVVGGTPLVQLDTRTRASVAAKLEFMNPAHSVKDRLGVAIINDAERTGQIRAGDTIVEATSGNTGIALAMAGAARGYRVVLTMPESMSIERRQLLTALGAEVVLTPASAGMQGAVDRAEAIAAERHGILAHQFSTPANAEIHRRTTAEEIWRDTDGQIDAVVAGVGTGGTITGIGQVLKQRKPAIRIIAVEPAESPLLSSGHAGAHKIQGIGANFVPDVLDRSVIDEVLPRSYDQARDAARLAATRDGLLVGLSSGAAFSAAAEVADREEFANGLIVVIAPDSAERYLSTDLFSTT